MFSSAMNALRKYPVERIIVKESMCNPCPRTIVTHVSGLYTLPKGKGIKDKGNKIKNSKYHCLSSKINAILSVAFYLLKILCRGDSLWSPKNAYISDHIGQTRRSAPTINRIVAMMGRHGGLPLQSTELLR